jgi:hypothetical protein
VTQTQEQKQERAGEQAGKQAQDQPQDRPQAPAPVAEPVADCVLCGEPTEHPASTRGATYCPVCEWQEAQRTACSG